MLTIPKNFWRDVHAPPKPETLARLETQIRVWEMKLGLTTEEVQEGLRAGTLQQTWEVCDLLLRVSLRDDLVAATVAS